MILIIVHEFREFERLNYTNITWHECLYTNIIRLCHIACATIRSKLLHKYLDIKNSNNCVNVWNELMFQCQYQCASMIQLWCNTYKHVEIFSLYWLWITVVARFDVFVLSRRYLYLVLIKIMENKIEIFKIIDI